ncbi:PSD1 and planctomycete cytochrome C domain-containing protein [Bryobacter aggregatus]|uniref:PSD1 and planctomycete cytochrome C domain-containing protein n=1 Tax=Bryobacter aggregatus TaxID=360054 RepID=UPI0004E168CA|nr:PSD1 and planctomycete cytochrome C domain-containing protein [Bryobacter aggregatus]
MSLRTAILASLAAFQLSAAPDSFDAGVKPIFTAKCISCHNEKMAMGKLDLHSAEATLKGGASGPAVVPGSAAKSLLIDKIVTRQMPPGPAKLSDAEIDQIRVWIDRGIEKAVEPAIEVTEFEVRGILQARCVRCHGSEVQEGGLDLRTIASRIKGGKSGTALVPGKPEESPLYKRMQNGQMPPAKQAKELAVELPTDGETEKVRAWIAAGAQNTGTITPDIVKESDKAFWSFQSPKRPALPAIKASNPIDAFLLVKLQAKGLRFNKEANRLSLMRRVYLDLTGLPPTVAEIAAYEADTAPGAYERLVDRLLASPHYGERWGQHWLDVAGYSDSEGFGQDDGVRKYAWRYRDYVVRSLNADKPYDRFLTEQIAGDEMSDDWKKTKTGVPQELIDRLAATGFLRTTPDPTNSNERGLLSERMNVVADEVEVLSSSVMGLTVGCARCHNHKYDPIPQRDYYRLSAILQGAYDPYEWHSPNKRELDLALDSEKEVVAKHNAPLEAEIKKLEAAKASRKEIGEVRSKLMTKPHVRVLTDNVQPSQSYLLRRGDPANFGEPVEPNTPQVLKNASLKDYTPVSPFPGSTGRRLALAKWLTQPEHPLTARVLVNQLWMRHFGRGIVASVANFGKSGVAPSHPELLDWLATEFVAKGWSMKSMHRLMVTSQAYRQDSNVAEAVLKADPENILLSRMPLNRMDAETLYDSLIQVSGRLDPTSFGAPTDIEVRADKEVTVKASKTGYRRSIYVLHRRQTPVSLMDAFDQPSMTPNCTERRRSNVATQALHMMNGSMSWDLAKYMAGRVMDEADGDRARQIELVYLRAYARRPSAAEVQTGIQAVQDFQKAWPAKLASDGSDAPRETQAKWLALANYCHAILNSAEFSFID